MTSFLLTLYRKRWSAAFALYRKHSRAKAVRLHCLQCFGGSAKEVATCNATLCPLWPFRSGGKYEDPPPEARTLIKAAIIQGQKEKPPREISPAAAEGLKKYQDQQKKATS
ncbi:MAG: hypothetical protein KKC18_06860 [Chloroflexi bacterium]|nr:hypothetical protein [Chloroflexota bacterium]